MHLPYRLTTWLKKTCHHSLEGSIESINILTFKGKTQSMKEKCIRNTPLGSRMAPQTRKEGPSLPDRRWLGRQEDTCMHNIWTFLAFIKFFDVCIKKEQQKLIAEDENVKNAGPRHQAFSINGIKKRKNSIPGNHIWSYTQPLEARD